MIRIFAVMIMLWCMTMPSFATNADTLYVTPNPFDSVTAIHFNLEQNDTVSLFVSNMFGNKIRTFYENAYLQSGSYSEVFVADTLSYGVYIVFLQINSTIYLHVNAIHAPVGINDQGLEARNPMLFPNPTSGMLTIPYEGGKRVVVTDLKGRVLRNLTISANNVNLGNLGAGTYLVTVLSGKDQIMSTQRVELIR